MDMIEVDPKLFVTCRLCLVDLGQFQIVPSVQQQIKYCFDIDVEPFDGLPQLICMKCKDILSNFFSIKKVLCEKQKNLRNKVTRKENDEKCIQPQQDAVSSSQPTSENANIKKKPRSTPKIKIRRLMGSSESDNSCNATKFKKKRSVKRWSNWESEGFERLFGCTVCRSEWPSLKSFYGHYRVHLNLRTKYPSIFKNNCLVTLDKIDDKPNISGVSNVVVHSNDKIIETCNSSYYIRYYKEKMDDNESESVVLSDSQLEGHVDTESTDTDQEIVARPKRRKRRIISRSSNETVVIESNSNKAMSDYEEETKIVTPVCHNTQSAQTNDNLCINIDDSSDSDKEVYQTESNPRTKQPMEAKLADYKIIQGIITMCVNAYHKKSELVEKSDKQVNSESQLKHKVLSIGRKIINKQGFNCTGLLRYLEHKNIGIIWMPKALPNSNSKESQNMRVITKLRGPESVDDNLVWVPLWMAPIQVPVDKPETNLSLKQQSPPVTQNLNNKPPAKDKAILYICTAPDSKNKLLNANPVANPKQLPRKLLTSSDLRLNITMPETNTQFHNVEDTDTHLLRLPIITSTKSLAEPAVTENGITTPAATSTVETPAPRIKVKPVSELMSERTLISLRNEQSASVSNTNMLSNQNTKDTVPIQTANTDSVVVNQIKTTNNIMLNQNIWGSQNVPNLYLQPIQMIQLSCLDVPPAAAFQTVVSSPPTPAICATSKRKEEYVIMDTVELPNTKTNSPFRYLKSLLRVYNIILFDPHESVPREFVCLIKFKVQFNQEPIYEPVELCLSLYCSKNKFCFTVRDRNQMNININKISPNWQWEILNVFFRGDLVDKLLQNAQKHSQDTHDYTKKFLCLLKSIKFTKLS